MKNNIVTSIFIFLFMSTQAQDLIDISAKEIFECTSQKMKSMDKVSEKQIDFIFTTCTRDIYNSRVKSILNYYHFTTETVDLYNKFSEDVNDRIMNNSTKNNTTNTNNTNNTDNTDNIESTITDSNETINNDGVINKESRENNSNFDPVKITITSYEVKRFPTYTGKDKNGVEYEFIYLKPFTTDIMHRYNRIKTGDRFLVSYYEIDIFDETINDFITYKYIYQLLRQ